MVQLCIYSELVALIQGTRPSHAYVVLGDDSMLTVRLRDYLYYCNSARDRFVAFASGEEHSLLEKQVERRAVESEVFVGSVLLACVARRGVQ